MLLTYGSFLTEAHSESEYCGSMKNTNTPHKISTTQLDYRIQRCRHERLRAALCFHPAQGNSSNSSPTEVSTVQPNTSANHKKREPLLTTIFSFAIELGERANQRLERVLS